MKRLLEGLFPAVFLSVLLAGVPWGSAHAFHDVVISDYIEGSGNNKAIELFNMTIAEIDLAAGNYALEVHFNGSSSPGTRSGTASPWTPLTGSAATTTPAGRCRSGRPPGARSR